MSIESSEFHKDYHLTNVSQQCSCLTFMLKRISHKSKIVVWRCPRILVSETGMAYGLGHRCRAFPLDSSFVSHEPSISTRSRTRAVIRTGVRFFVYSRAARRKNMRIGEHRYRKFARIGEHRYRKFRGTPRCTPGSSTRDEPLHFFPVDARETSWEARGSSLGGRHFPVRRA